MPQIYSGDEIAMTGGADPDNRHDFPGGFPDGVQGQPKTQQSAFLAASRSPAQEEMHRWVKGLLDLRHSHTVLQTGEEQVLTADTNLLAYVRGDGLQQGCSAKGSAERMLVVVNKGDQPQTFTIPEDHTALENCGMKEHLWGTATSFHIENNTVQIVIQPSTSAIASFDWQTPDTATRR
jgi:glycosidase